MNLFDYLDKRNRRKIILGQLKYWRNEYISYALCIDNVPESLMKVHTDGSLRVKEEIKYYMDKLNELI